MKLVVEFHDLRQDGVESFVVDGRTGDFLEVVVHAYVRLIQEHIDLRRRSARVGLRFLSRAKLGRSSQLIREAEQSRFLLQSLAHVGLRDLELLDIGHRVKPNDATWPEPSLRARWVEA